MKLIVLALLFPAVAFAEPKPRPTPRPMLTGSSPQDAAARNILDMGPKRYAKHLTLASDTGHWPALFEQYPLFADSVRAFAKACNASEAADALLAAKQTDVTLDPTEYVASAETRASSEISPLRSREKEDADWQTKPAWLTVSPVGLDSSGTIAIACAAAWIGPSSEIADCYVLKKTDEIWTPACRTALWRH